MKAGSFGSLSGRRMLRGWGEVMAKTRIEWTEYSWNPITGCTPVSEGCQNCYAKRMANRLRGRCGYPADEPFKVTLHEDRLGEPLRWKKPRRVFVCSMGDLFHEDVPFDFICDVFARMGFERRHTFLVLTKRPERMRELFTGYENYRWPHPNVYLGVTAENQRAADERIPILLEIPAAVRFVSIEPMLGPVDLLSNDYLGGCINCEVCLDNPETCINCAQDRKINWIICGSETGPGRRPAKIAWIMDLKDQCQSAGVPFFLKQMEVDGKIVKMPGLDGRTWDEMPEI